MFDRIRHDAGQMRIRDTGVLVPAVIGTVAQVTAIEKVLAQHPGLEADDVRQALRYARWLIDEERDD